MFLISIKAHVTLKIILFIHDKIATISKHVSSIFMLHKCIHQDMRYLRDYV